MNSTDDTTYTLRLASAMADWAVVVAAAATAKAAVVADVVVVAAVVDDVYIAAAMTPAPTTRMAAPSPSANVLREMPDVVPVSVAEIERPGLLITVT